ncbi:glycoside hydrolase family 3 N-terminal domain-containing protein [Sporocytophaga myxococcoides]|uniref:glycoside hydrolase family 3 N-terminal domain-containing protein n=1 Tax=Sporocytophaga myxococcoides TaxID=153721 RepID=UPI00041ED783|nr:glycoside hydrolase family 3 N-terminal domain-containing protein [Sporocytophaga myxococcoides]
MFSSKKFNRQLCCLFFSLVIPFTSFSQKGDKAKVVSELIARMTLEEKVGQMTNLTLSAITEPSDDPLKVDPAKLREVIVKHNIGSIQNVVKHAYSIEEWHKLINEIQKVSLTETRLKIPFLYCIDAVHGTNFTLNSTLFPHNLGLAATRNPELVKLCAEITAKEVRASGIRYNFSPVLDVGRQPLWPRFPETFGEDVLLTKTMGVASVKGYEGKSLNDFTSVASCMKHFVGYSVPANGKDRAAAYIPEINLREYFLPPFKAAVDAGAHTLMVNSGEVNGTPVHASRFLLTDVLRNELNYKGIVISDWEDIKKLTERHKVAENHKEAVYLSVNAGIDMCIVPFDFSFYNDLIALVKEGRIKEERINESVKRILDLKFDLGIFERPYVEKEAVKNFGLPEYTQAALAAARESITLLKNSDQVLPLKRDKRVLVVGSNANSLTALNGAWSYTWQGRKAEYFPKTELTILDALKKKAGDINIVYKKDFKDVTSAEAKPDYIIVALGEDAYAETPGNTKTLELASEDIEGVRNIVKLYPGIPLIYVLTEGRPRLIREIEPFAKGVLMAYWPGSQGGNAVADILYGDYNPSGKLPFTYPRYSGELMTYDHKWLDEAVEIVEPEYKYLYEFEPQYPFGFGMSYTNFTLSNLKLSSDQLTGDSKIKVSVDIKNTGQRVGKETVELYSRDHFASVTPSVKRLRGFKKVELQPGELKTVEFEISREDLAFVGTDMKWRTEPGGFDLIVGDLNVVLNYKGQ